MFLINYLNKNEILCLQLGVSSYVSVCQQVQPDARSPADQPAHARVALLGLFHPCCIDWDVNYPSRIKQLWLSVK